MNVYVRFRNETHEVQLRANATTLRALMEVIEKKLQILRSEQVLIFRGHRLTEKDKLTDFGIKPGTKILLVSQEQDKDEEMGAGMRTRSKVRNQPERGREVIRPNLEDSPHWDIIMKGPPEGCMKGEKLAVNQFPKKDFTHLVVYNTDGFISKMTVETDGIYIETDNRPERIFITDIKEEGVISQDIPTHPDEYIVLHLFIGFERKSFYFIPKQFQKLIEDHLKGR